MGVGAEVGGVHGEVWDGVEDVKDRADVVFHEPEVEQELGMWHVEGEGIGGVGVRGRAQALAGGAWVEARAGCLE